MRAFTDERNATVQPRGFQFVRRHIIAIANLAVLTDCNLFIQNRTIKHTPGPDDGVKKHDRVPYHCTFLDNHRDQLLGFAAQLDCALAELAQRCHVSVDTCRALLRLQALSYAHPRRGPAEAELRRQLHGRFHDLHEAVRELAQRTVRASSLVENLNSRLRNYFTLRRHLGADYLALLQFFFNHRRFDRSECPQRAGKSPAELLTGHSHPHWLAMLGYQPFSQN